jgi:hypothetical protein
VKKRQNLRDKNLLGRASPIEGWYFTNRLLYKRFIVLLSGAFAYSCPTREYSFDRQIGVVAERSAKTCLVIRSSTVTVGRSVEVVSPIPPQSSITMRVAATDRACVPEAAEPDVSGYRLSGSGEAAQLPGIGILDDRGSFRQQDGLLTADLDRDGTPEYFRSCLSGEGVHFSIWSGKPLEGRLKWHQYYYLGYDVEPDCKPEETILK